jgi:replication factor C small subunit
MKELLTEKYRPKTLDEIALPERVKNILKNGIQTNLLLYGTQGTGKTSTAKLMVKSFKHSYIYINCSKETGIDTIREKISNFCMSSSLMSGGNGLKVVIMDEMDGMSAQAYQALRGCIEEFACNTRFVATCNFVSKVPEPIQSRFECISFDFDSEETLEVKKQYAKRIKHICDNEGIGIDKEAISMLMKNNFPDMRSIVNKLQSMIIQNVEHITVENVSKTNSECTDIFDLVINTTDPVENYKMIVGNYSTKIDEALNSLGKEFIEYITSSKPDLVKFIPHITIIAAKYQSQKNMCIDPVVCLLACVYEMQQTIHQKL